MSFQWKQTELSEIESGIAGFKTHEIDVVSF